MSTMERILRLMADKQASDVYLTAHAPAQIRIHGQCVPINQQVLPPDAPRKLLAEIVPHDRLVEFDRTGELNMGHAVEGLGNFRISALRQRGTCAVVVRFIPPVIPALSTLNLPAVLADLVVERRGLVLMAGSTGSGKSTTLAAMLDLRNELMPGHILTIEDPIEFIFQHKRSVVNQREVGADTESLEVALRNGLRQAPDVILIGEIRDAATMSAALAYAQSGHLVMATLHANNSYQALHRILSFFPEQVRPILLGDLAATLRAVVSQRLLRNRAGGRVPAVEVMLNTQRVAELIGAGDFTAVKEAMEKSMAEGSQTFEQDIARLIATGAVDQAEGLAHCDSASNLLWRLQNDFSTPAPSGPAEDPDDVPSFTEITLDVKPS
ncbi:PilT/PilU family type 4a pilus ATPase [Ramlibacter sp. MAHUQ-53]|uniref:PilT/PilU family type 4a pilus ATPase n=1 Tax=unclassified Ramlibacter TaxID=2617605 RepID=UPI003645DE36